jgi:gluconokinase
MKLTPPLPLIVVMGVSGSGKTTVGAAIGQRLRLPFADADGMHSDANVAKMSAGIPLEDTDRWPWLARIGDWLAQHRDTGGVMTCSALKRAYRDILRKSAPETTFVHLYGEPGVIRQRMAARAGHFMPESLLASQFDALEPLEPDEKGFVLDLDAPVDQIVGTFLAVTGIAAERR